MILQNYEFGYYILHKKIIPLPTKQFIPYVQHNRYVWSDAKSANITVKSLDIPKLNVSRNQFRFTTTMNALLLFLDSNLKHITPETKRILSALSYSLNVSFDKDPALFVIEQKFYANWIKVNLLRDHRFHANVPYPLYSTRYNCPKIFVELFVELERLDDQRITRDALRFLLSMILIYNTVTVPKMPSLDTITDAFSGDKNFIEDFNVKGAFESLGLDLNTIRENHADNVANLKWHTSSSSGPNGQALWMSHIDARAIFSDKAIHDALVDFCTLEGLDIMDKCEDSYRLPNFFKIGSATPEHSKLHLIFEKGNKCRVIAIVDYWTQQALCPIHNTIQNILKTLPNDGTFDQDKVIFLVKGMTAIQTSELHSLDLTAATDRLPARLQSRILTELLGVKGYGDKWAAILTNRGFKLPNGDILRYTVGQPMGAKSSFPMLALTHHLIVQNAALKVGLPSFTNYVILGDDIVINSTNVAVQYMKDMQSLGLSISVNKSIISTPTTSSYRCAEICQRLFCNGLDFSPIPTKLVATVIEKGDMAYQLQEELGRRDLLIGQSELLIFFSGIIKPNDIKFLAQLNGLPNEISGMRFSSPFIEFPLLNSSNFQAEYGISQENLLEFYTFVILVEQLKRADSILKNTTDIYTTITKAAAVSQTVGIGSPEKGYLPVEHFTAQEMDEWDIIETFHPAVAAVRDDVDRINLILMQLVAADANVKAMLRRKLIDSLRISSYENMPDADFVKVKVTRKLINSMLKCLSAAKMSKHQDQNYTVKLSRLNILWFVKVTLNSPCTISRTFSKISTFASDAKQKSLQNVVSFSRDRIL